MEKIYVNNKKEQFFLHHIKAIAIRNFSVKSWIQISWQVQYLRNFGNNIFWCVHWRLHTIQDQSSKLFSRTKYLMKLNADAWCSACRFHLRQEWVFRVIFRGRRNICLTWRLSTDTPDIVFHFHVRQLSISNHFPSWCNAIENGSWFIFPRALRSIFR